MFAIVSTDKHNRRWLSGVFETRSESEAEIARISGAGKAHHCMVDINISGFPIFVIEDNGFSFGNIELVKEKLSSYTPIGNDEFCHFNIFLISETYVPKRSGCDEMGRLMHWHVTDDYLRPANRTQVIQMFLNSVNNI